MGCEKEGRRRIIHSGRLLKTQRRGRGEGNKLSKGKGQGQIKEEQIKNKRPDAQGRQASQPESKKKKKGNKEKQSGAKANMIYPFAEGGAIASEVKRKKRGGVSGEGRAARPKQGKKKNDCGERPNDSDEGGRDSWSSHRSGGREGDNACPEGKKNKVGKKKRAKNNASGVSRGSKGRTSKGLPLMMVPCGAKGGEKESTKRGRGKFPGRSSSASGGRKKENRNAIHANVKWGEKGVVRKRKGDH